MSEAPLDANRPVDPDATTLQRDSPARPPSFGPYRLLERLGEGGMGQVWLAEQVDPVRRRVAVKVIKAGMDSRQVIARFEAERQALALMNHPAIATVFDGGVTPEGRLYFVMEYVPGEPITTYCDRHRLSPEDRLRLFIRVCEGVQHAHQKGIIHRDLKPSNVLVTVQDDKPVPKIIDFGVAKATASQFGAHSLFTELGALVGTPEYMSPEQAEMTAVDIDTRTDIYALGVMLYELLTGAMPVERERLRRAGLAEIHRVIREEEPPRPSTRVTQAEPQSSSVTARNRGLDPSRLAGELRGDLDWITMKALEKDRTRRYDTATGLANDLQRHLRNEPVSAGPPSATYRAGKFVRRHRIGVSVTALIGVLLVTFAVAMGVQAQRIARERDRANREAERANLEAATAGRVADFLAGLFKVSDPAEARGRAITAREVLDKGAARIGSELSRDPLLQSRLLFTMGDVYRNLGALDEAEQLVGQSVEIRRRSLGPEAPETLRASSLLGCIYDFEGKSDLAVKTLEAVLQSERRVLGDGDPQTLKTLANLANAYDSLGRYDKSVPMTKDVFERRRKVLGADHLDTLGSQYNLAVALYRQERLDDAERLLKGLAASFTRVAGADHPNTLLAKDLLASVYEALKRPGDAKLVLDEIYDMRRRVLGPDHMDTLATQLGLANVARLEKRYPDAERLFRDTLAAQGRTLGADHPDAIATRVSLATMLSDAGRDSEAELAFRDSLARMQRSLGSNHPSTSNCLIGLAIIEMRHGRRQAALELLKQAVRVNPSAGPALAKDETFAGLKGMTEFDAFATAGSKR